MWQTRCARSRRRHRFRELGLSRWTIIWEITRRIDNTDHNPVMAMRFKKAICAPAFAKSAGRAGSRLLHCIEATQLIGARGYIFAIAMTTRASGKRQTRDDISHILDTVLGSHRIAGIRSGRNADAAQQAEPVRVSKRAQRAGGRETCASVVLCRKTDITCCAEAEVCSDTSLIVSANGVNVRPAAQHTIQQR